MMAEHDRCTSRWPPICSLFPTSLSRQFWARWRRSCWSERSAPDERDGHESVEEVDLLDAGRGIALDWAHRALHLGGRGGGKAIAAAKEGGGGTGRGDQRRTTEDSEAAAAADAEAWKEGATARRLRLSRPCLVREPGSHVVWSRANASEPMKAAYPAERAADVGWKDVTRGRIWERVRTGWTLQPVSTNFFSTAPGPIIRQSNPSSRQLQIKRFIVSGGPPSQSPPIYHRASFNLGQV